MIESDYLKESEDLIQKLRGIPTLESFDEKDLKGILKLSKIRKYEPGELILEEGQYDNWVYFLVSGKVRIVKGDKEASYVDRLSGNDRTAFCCILYQVFAEIIASRLRLTSEELVRAREEIAGLKAQLGK
ncbi:MAG: cyclic nucleotide-binding domain-containing protein [Deltaproteobacteria bacterium]|nr:cyclic nucleotide-binding domain-containing protein [Deltaproteobacteria bacterium]